MPVYAEMVGDLRAIDFRTNIAVAHAVAATAEDFLQILKEEIPWDSIKDDVTIDYGVVLGDRASRDQVSAKIVIGAKTGANEYIYELWKGNEERTHTAHGQFMVFDNWANGPDEFRWPRDGKFHFKQVNHPAIEGNDFVGRAIARLRILVNASFGQKFANYFKNIRR